jgi:hypothetical protein
MKRLPNCLFLLVVILPLSLNARQSREIHKSVPLKPGGHVSIETTKGSITIKTWEKSEVDVTARIEADDNFFDSDRENVDETEVRVEGSDSEVRIVTDYERLRHHHTSFWGWFEDHSEGQQPSVYYTITMPQTINLKIKDYKSTSTIAPLRGDIDMETYKGEVNVSGLEGSMTLDTYKGEAHLEFAKMSGDSKFKSYKGDVTVTLPAISGFVLDTDFGRHADYSTDFDMPMESGHRRHREDTMHGSINGGGPELRLSSERGTFTLRASK